MSATPTRPRPLRLQRSALAVPATSEHFFAKAAASAADAVFIDLEDAVAENRKDDGRKFAITAINEFDWGEKLISVRINGLDTRWALEDIVEVARNCPRLDMILLPKTGTRFDIQFVAHVLTLIEREKRQVKRIGVEALIESALGVANVESIASSSDRLEALIFGIGDYTIDMRTYDLELGVPSSRYSMLTGPNSEGKREAHLNDQWHFALARVVNACRAAGIRAIDGPYPSFRDLAGFQSSAQRGAALGFEGKWTIHPSQIAIANEVFSPSKVQVEWSEGVMQSLGKHLDSGVGAFANDGVLIDLAHVKLAHSIKERAELVDAASHGAKALR